MRPAQAWRRYCAWSIDTALLAIPALLLCWPHTSSVAAQLAAASDGLLQQAARSLFDTLSSGLPPTALATQWLADPIMSAAIHSVSQLIWSSLWPPLLLMAAIGAPYHARLESSARQATVGQHLLGLRIVDMQGGRITASRALLRHVAGVLSWLTLNIGHLMAMLPPGHRALHDIVAGTRMLQDDYHAALPAWARAWLLLQGLVLACAAVTLYRFMQGAMQAGIDSLLY